jgi:2,5-diketo-D-gluconate reductase A
MDMESTLTLHTGRTMPILGLGTWDLSNNTADTIAYAIEIGYRMIDTSSDYGTQGAVGDAIKKQQLPRDSLFITTKVEETDDAYEAAKRYVEDMGTGYADLILIHRPPDDGAGEALWEGLIRARDEGITRDIGVSNYTTDLMDELYEASDERPVVNQIEWTPFGNDMNILSYCNSNRIVLQAYSPLTRGLRLDDKTLQQLATKHEKSPAQILIRWNLQTGTVPIVKANQRQHLEENLEVFDFELSDEDMSILNNLNENWSSLSDSPMYV